MLRQQSAKFALKLRPRLAQRAVQILRSLLTRYGPRY
jgi:hypothetical protein